MSHFTMKWTTNTKLATASAATNVLNAAVDVAVDTSVVTKTALVVGTVSSLAYLATKANRAEAAANDEGDPR